MPLPSNAIVGQSTRPSVNFVSWRSAPPEIERVHRFGAPLRSLTKYSAFPSADHIGHSFFAPAAVTRSYFGGVRAPAATPCTSQISLSSMWLCPFRHHCDDVMPRAVMAIVPSSGPVAAQYSDAYRSAATATGVPPLAPTRATSLMPEISLAVVEKKIHLPSCDHASS